MSVRAKFKVNSVNRFEFGETVTLIPVYSTDQDSENYRFWSATPSGKLEMQISNPEAQGMFEPGQEFYIDLSPVGTISAVG